MRLTHAQASEEVGATKSLLLSIEAKMVDIQQQQEERPLEGQVKALNGRTQQVSLLDREVGFWKA